MIIIMFYKMRLQRWNNGSIYYILASQLRCSWYLLAVLLSVLLVSSLLSGGAPGILTSGSVCCWYPGSGFWLCSSVRVLVSSPLLAVLHSLCWYVLLCMCTFEGASHFRLMHQVVFLS